MTTNPVSGIIGYINMRDGMNINSPLSLAVSIQRYCDSIPRYLGCLLTLNRAMQTLEVSPQKETLPGNNITQ